MDEETKTDPKVSNNLLSGFLKSVRDFPLNPALHLDNQTYTYAEIDRKARILAASILTRMEKAPKRIGVLGNKSLPTYIGIIASQMIGASYVPLNSNVGPERIAHIVSEASLDAIICDLSAFSSGVLSRVEANNCPLLFCPDIDYHPEGTRAIVFTRKHISSVPALDTLSLAVQSDVAYILFTSGTSGRPKGVPITHRNVHSFLEYNQQRYQFSSDDRFTQTFHHTFDLSVFDMFMAWGAGAMVCPLSSLDLLAPQRKVEELGITVWFSVPSVLMILRSGNRLKPNSMPSLKWSLFCGEPLLVPAVSDWEKAAPNSIIENLYGPTELTIACSHYRWDGSQSLRESENGIVPMGKVYPTLNYSIVDENLHPITGCDSGELCISGPQMFEGYLNNSEKTLQALIHLPHHPGNLFYRTGDIVSVNGLGNLIYHGRSDHQVKVMGYRVELTEVEFYLQRCQGVLEAAATTYTSEDGSGDRIVAFVLGEDIQVDCVFKELKQSLPKYMIPWRINVVKELPRNLNGKLDRKQLRLLFDSEREDRWIGNA